uniref:Uncharacterized protein n=1 Tax=Rhizophora mucronata TaxID=61149 RepID=A0A2P2NSD9_RHIMU
MDAYFCTAAMHIHTTQVLCEDFNSGKRFYTNCYPLFGHYSM